MAAIKGRDTKPELVVRKALHALGFRYRKNVRGLPGKPDLVFPKYNAVVFINGCFWHQHDCHLFKWPGTREDFWREKIGRNALNDLRNRDALVSKGWRVAEIWECAMKGKTRLDPEVSVKKLAQWLVSSSDSISIKGQE